MIAAIRYTVSHYGFPGDGLFFAALPSEDFILFDFTYNRIKGLGIATQMTEIRFINVFSPYWYFTFMDPDGNPIEITGNYADGL